MANKPAPKYVGHPCGNHPEHVHDGHSVRYVKSKACVECALEYAAKQIQDRRAARAAQIEAVRA